MLLATPWFQDVLRYDQPPCRGRKTPATKSTEGKRYKGYGTLLAYEYKMPRPAPVQVTLTSPTRKQPSVLPWKLIDLVYREAPPSVLRTVDVDRILDEPQYRHSATLCALVLALKHPSRVLSDVTETVDTGKATDKRGSRGLAECHPSALIRREENQGA